MGTNSLEILSWIPTQSARWCSAWVQWQKTVLSHILKIWINALCAINWNFVCRQHSENDSTVLNQILIAFQKNKIYLGNATWVHGGHLNCMLLKNCSVILLILLPSSAHYCGNCRGFSCIFLTMEHVASLLPFHCQREGVCPRLSSLHHLCSLWCCSQVRSSKHSVFFQLTSGFSVIKNLIGDINPLTWFVLPDNVTVWIEWKHVLLVFYSFKRWRDNREVAAGSMSLRAPCLSTKDNHMLLFPAVVMKITPCVGPVPLQPARIPAARWMCKYRMQRGEKKHI